MSLLPRLQSEPEWETVAADVRARTLELLEQRVSDEDTPARLLEVHARLLVEDGDLSRGVEALRRARRSAPASRLRLTLAELLDQQGDGAGAQREVERYLLQHPGDARGAKLLDRLRDR